MSEFNSHTSVALKVSVTGSPQLIFCGECNLFHVNSFIHSFQQNLFKAKFKVGAAIGGFRERKKENSKMY